MNSDKSNTNSHTPYTPQAEEPRIRIVMLVANQFMHDTRVFKEARSLILWGCDVHVIALAGNDLPGYEQIDCIHVHRVTWPNWLVLLLPVGLCCWWSRRLLGFMFSSSDSSHDEQRVDSGVFLTLFCRALNILRVFWRGLKFAIRSTRAIFNFTFGSPLMIGISRATTSWLRRIKRMYPGSFRLLAFNIACVRKAIELQPDVIQSHDLNTLLAGAFVKRLTGRPLVYDSHELFLERNLGNRSRAWDNIVWAPIERFFIRRCDAVLAVTESICQHLSRQYNIPPPHLIRNVQPYEYFAERTSILADEIGISRDKAIVLFPGAVTVNRGLEMMIDSAPLLCDAVYVIMGGAQNPSYLHSLKRRAEELGQLNRTVFFREAVPIDQVAIYCASADLGIIPTPNVCLSYYYGLGNKHFHLLMAGVPIVASDHPEQAALIRRYGVGAVFDETDAQDIVRVVNKTLADRNTLSKMSARCLDAARQLNWEHEEKHLRQIFATLLGHRAKPIPNVSLPAVSHTLDTSGAGTIPLSA